MNVLNNINYVILKFAESHNFNTMFPIPVVIAIYKNKCNTNWRSYFMQMQQLRRTPPQCPIYFDDNFRLK